MMLSFSLTNMKPNEQTEASIADALNIKMPKSAASRDPRYAFTLGIATNKTIYTLANIEAKLQGKSVSTFLEEILKERYKNFI